MHERVAFILVDGVGDVSIPRLGLRTPLEASMVPNLDAMAAAGVNGLMDPVEAGLACGSDTAHLSILGYDPRVYYRGRGAFESMGAGLAMSPGDIAFKSNFATLDELTGVVVKRRADRHFEQLGPLLCSYLDCLHLPSYPNYVVNFRYATEHRCGVVIRGPGLSGNISGTDPLKDNRPLLEAKPLDETEEALRTALIVNELSEMIHRKLKDHPINAQRLIEGKNAANLVLLRGCGIRIKVPSFESMHGLRACMVAPTKIIAGLGMSLGISILDVPEATGDYRTHLTAKAMAIGHALTHPFTGKMPRVVVPGDSESRPGAAEGYTFGFLHIKAIDDAGHDKLPLLKVRALESVDRMIGQLTRVLWEAEREGAGKYTLVVTGDHSTPVEYGDHSHEPVPFTICHLRDFVDVRGGEDVVLSTDMSPFLLPQDEGDGDCDLQRVSGTPEMVMTTDRSGEKIDQLKSDQAGGKGDSVREFGEMAAARGLLGRFTGREMMGVIRGFAGVANTSLAGLGVGVELASPDHIIATA